MSFDPQSDQVVVFKNNAAVMIWLIMAAWIAALVYFTRVAMTTSEVPGFLAAVLAVFWIAGLVIAALSLWAPHVRVEISSDGVFVSERAPLWKRQRQFAARDLSVSDIIENEDSEGGGINYTCSLLLPDNESIILVQGNSRPKVVQERGQLIGALRTAQRRAQ